jgi:hypothetical protein
MATAGYLTLVDGYKGGIPGELCENPGGLEQNNKAFTRLRMCYQQGWGQGN